MPTPRQPWTAEDEATRDRILRAARERSATQIDLARAAGIGDAAGQVRMHRWSRGAAHLTAEQLAAIDAYLSGLPVGGLVLGGESELAELADFAGPPDLADDEELRVLARSHRRAAVGAIARLMVGARSENVRLRAAEVLLERSDGRPLARVVDETPRPPVVDTELIAILERMVVRDGV